MKQTAIKTWSKPFLTLCCLLALVLVCFPMTAKAEPVTDYIGQSGLNLTLKRPDSGSQMAVELRGGVLTEVLNSWDLDSSNVDDVSDAVNVAYLGDVTVGETITLSCVGTPDSSSTGTRTQATYTLFKTDNETVEDWDSNEGVQAQISYTVAGDDTEIWVDCAFGDFIDGSGDSKNLRFKANYTVVAETSAAAAREQDDEGLIFGLDANMIIVIAMGVVVVAALTVIIILLVKRSRPDKGAPAQSIFPAAYPPVSMPPAAMPPIQPAAPKQAATAPEGQKCVCGNIITGAFCERCGRPAAPEQTLAPSTAVCPKCGVEMPAEAKFCTKCGSPMG